jgi:hypothetical protein
LTGLRRVSAPGARLVFNASNSRNAKRIARYLIGTGSRCPFVPGPVQYDARSYGWPPEELVRLLAETGFHLRALRGVGVLDKVAARAGRLGPLVPPGTTLSRPLGWLRLAPSLFDGAVAGSGGEEQDERVFSCPICGDHLAAPGAGYGCPACNRSYPLREGILDFRV